MNKKQLVCALLAAVMTVSGTALPSAAEGVTAQTGDVQSAGRIIEGDKFLYRTEADGTATILDLTEKAVSSKGVVTIPDKLDGATVAGISVSTADFFRSHWDTVKRVDFPVTLTEIKDKGKVDRTEHTIGIGFKDERYIPAEFDAMSFRFVTYKPNQKTKIKCARGSEIEQYAVENNVPYSYVGAKKTQLPEPVVKYNSKSTLSTVKFSWFPVAGADGYLVYSYTSTNSKIGSKKYRGKLSGKSNTTFKDTGLKEKYTYNYEVKAYKKLNGKTYLSKVNCFSYTTKPSKPKIKAVDYCGFALKKQTRNGSYYQAMEIYDYENKAWYPIVFRSVKDKDGYRYVYPTKYAIKDPETLEVYCEKIDTSKKYKFRVRIAAGGNYSDYSNVVKYTPAKV